MITSEKNTVQKGYALSEDVGVVDLWWPYGPDVGRYTIKVASEQTDGRLFQVLVRDRRGAARFIAALSFLALCDSSLG